MNSIRVLLSYTMGWIFQLSLILGGGLIFVYVIVNMFSHSRAFYKASRFVKKITYRTIDFTKVWGPNLLIFYFLGRMLVRLLHLF